MVTRYRVGTNRPTQRLSLHVSSVSHLPKLYRDAFSDSNWKNAICDEYHAHIKNKTWTLVPRPTYTNIVRCMWLFRHKYHADGALSRYKALFIANGGTQLEGIDNDETFSPIVKPGTIRIGTDTAYLLLYVDDIVLTASSKTLVFLSQRKYDTKIIERAGMVSCNSSRTPVNTESKLGDDGDSVSDPITAVVSSSTTDLVAYSDADWAGCPTTRRSTSGYCVFLRNNLLSWSSKHQSKMYRSSAEAEYHGVANVVAETYWLRNLLHELHTPLSSATLVYCDIVSIVYLSSNPVQHQRTKYIEINIHFVRDLVAAGQV
ncbi:ribonuclease H-like domain-containing protein [Tanacetum coccineum]|uniref:Ribonuclease H-like domain-containing protein n=1 Tax=Tanacetum coccineum TaxID=301880 RepID=A0ABQ5D7W4_9ASTR